MFDYDQTNDFGTLLIYGIKEFPIGLACMFFHFGTLLIYGIKE